MGDWAAVALARVAREDVAAALSDIGTAWEDVAHVTATTTLTSAIRDTDAAAVPVATLRDLVVMPALPGSMKLPLRTFRNPTLAFRDDREEYERAVREWQNHATGRRLRIGVQVDDSLRSFVRSKADNALGRALVASRRTYASTIHTLVASGVRPQDLRPTDAMAQLAARAWEHAERDVPALGAPREWMWLDAQELCAGTSQRAQRVKAGLRAALDAAFGPAVDGRRTLVHHGFYFYTPAQWQLFQLLRALDEVDQVFVVHDDGANPALAVWRYYFRPEWGMPVPGQARTSSETVTPAAAWLRGVLSGEEEGSLAGVRLVEYRSPVDLVRDWATEAEGRGEDDPPVRYAASAKEVERFVQRLGRHLDVAGPHLSQLPVGTFLLALHACVERDRAGRIHVVLTQERVLDMVSSGFVRAESQGVRTPVFRRVLPYFGDCREPQQWLERAAMLVRTVTERVERLGGRSPADSDADRIDAAASNPVRLAPWVDLTRDEAAAVADLVERVVALVEEVVSRERVLLGDHLERVRGTLEGVLKGLPTAEREVVEAKLNGFGVLTGEEVDVDALVDVVAMLLGRTAEFDREQSGNDDPGESSSLRELRGLDSHGLKRSDHDLHLTNLAEDVFPTGASGVGWPFILDDLRTAVDRGGLDPIAVELLGTRAATAPLGDLYLLWLALDGVNGGAGVTLSWISRAAGEKRRLSPLAALLARLRHPDAAVRDVAGGLAAAPPAGGAASEVLGMRPGPADEQPVEDDVMSAAEDAVHPVAAASAWACPRRFALQWVLGPSAGYAPDYLTTMLYGNLTRALVRTGQENPLGARATTGAVWAHLTEGQRASSLDKAVVQASTGQGGPSPAWVWTLAGSGRGGTPLDAAYQAADGLQGPDFELLAPPASEFLPEGVTGDGAADVCVKCPVQTRCLHWQEPQR